ncbi:MAG TPA: ABC transporter ATP-binding protein [Micromonosporaceae bacterium]|jgi:ABC-type multidrug transport system fused ATPase/permease subunit|nr:ABC transporter ATP-binding protein [Micromonosporaceae bacterium]
MTAVSDLPPVRTLHTLRRGLALSPELRAGLAGTVALALVATSGRVVVPVAVQQGIDRGIRVPGGPHLDVIAAIVGVTIAVMMVTVSCGYLMNVRLYRVTETALAGVRTRTFRHIHDLSMLHQQFERRGVLTSRVTSDIDQISQFLQFGGVILLVSTGQLVVATVIMAAYSWQLTLVVYAAFAPLAVAIRFFQQRLAVAYQRVRERVGRLLSVIGESVVGAAVIRSYGVQGRTERRLDSAIEEYRTVQFRALRRSVYPFSAGELTAGLANAAVVVIGVLLGVGGEITVGELTAFVFLVALFVQPVQIATEVLNEAQNAVSGWRRVLDVLDTVPDIADPGPAGRDLPSGPIRVEFEHVDFGYPVHGQHGQTAPGPLVLHDVHLAIEPQTRVAVVGQTGSGKTTFAKLLTRLMDPTNGQVRLQGVPLPEVNFSSLRRRVVMVPQDGFLFDATIASNVRFAAPDIDDADLFLAFGELGLADWVEGLPAGLDTHVGERGEALSVGERQLVALARAYVADPDLLVLDEATSAVDPATEVRLQRALDAVTRGRTTVIIAHRLSTAEAADEVVVFGSGERTGRVVARGRHTELVSDVGSEYARLHRSWREQTRSAS